LQTRMESFIEAGANIASGFVLSLGVWMFVVMPLWGIELKLHDNLAITSIFTVTSLLRSYVWRRIGNWWALSAQRARTAAWLQVRLRGFRCALPRHMEKPYQ